MSNLAKILAAVVMVTGLILAGGTTASANSTTVYRDSMFYLLPVVDQWMTDVHKMATAAAAKPTDENIAEINRLAVTGTYILDDLRGTAVLVPSPLHTAHWSLADSLGSVATYADSFSDNPVEAADLICAEIERARPAHDKINNFLTRFEIIGRRGGDIPHVDS